jgi:hypothetical protein
MCWEVPVNDPHLTLTRLVLDTVACLRAAQSGPCHEKEVRAAIWLFSGVDLTDRQTAPALLCNMDRTLRALEDEFRLRNHCFAAQKARKVRERIRFMRQLATVH